MAQSGACSSAQGLNDSVFQVPIEEVKAIFTDDMRITPVYSVVRPPPAPFKELLNRLGATGVPSPSTCPPSANKWRTCESFLGAVKVLCSVLEQVKHFSETKYPPDGRTEPEVDFEDALEVRMWR